MITPKGEILEKPNRSSTPELLFEFHEDDLAGAVATWHTHPTTTANLSIDDYRFFQSWPNFTHFIVSTTEVWCYVTSKQLVYLIDDEADFPSRPSG